MAKTYAIKVLDTKGDMIFATRGRVGALVRAIAELREYQAACRAGSGYLYLNDKTKQDCLQVEGVTVHTEYTPAEDIIARFDKIGVEGMRAEREAELAAYRAEDEAYRLAGEIA